jgi:hypothetical protein
MVQRPPPADTHESPKNRTLRFDRSSRVGAARVHERRGHGRTGPRNDRWRRHRRAWWRRRAVHRWFRGRWQWRPERGRQAVEWRSRVGIGRHRGRRRGPERWRSEQRRSGARAPNRRACRAGTRSETPRGSSWSIPTASITRGTRGSAVRTTTASTTSPSCGPSSWLCRPTPASIPSAFTRRAVRTTAGCRSSSRARRRT